MRPAVERGLWCSVIQQALQDAVLNSTNMVSKAESEQAREWFIRNSSDFQYVCQLAGMEADSVRKSALDYIAQSQDATVEMRRTPKQRRPKGSKLSFEGRQMTVKEWALHLGVSYRSLAMRLVSGWSIERTLSTPVRSRRNRGAVKNLGEAPRDRCGSIAQDSTKIEIFP